ncbi:hypothetical protein WN944_025848 [Citrus x changshan-huyou]|uniref:FAE domain-containing protein n=1 Tax=Citrus x changshan-huyou TaxID=2935761 RepID=A0AAP0LRD2_9ROSI
MGNMAYVAKAMLDKPADKKNMAEARKETESVIIGAIDELLAKTGVKPRDIGILVANSSLFNPMPSLSAMVVNHYKLRGNILSYNFGGVGCSAGLISIDLAKQLLQHALIDLFSGLFRTNEITWAIGTIVATQLCAQVVSTENITMNWYAGNDRSMLLTNCLFRLGGAAILLSNRSSDRRRSKYELVHTLRTHKGGDDRSYNCVSQQEDESKRIGVKISKDLMAVAGESLKTNITTLGPLVLPMPEQLLFTATLVGRKIFKMKIKPYIPNFKLAFEHICIRAGGRAVLDEVGKHLKLNEWVMEPSRMTLQIWEHFKQLFVV